MFNIAPFIDHTILKPTCLIADIEKLCSEAKEYNFCAVCVPPNFVKLAKALLNNSSVKTATVIGFPFGYSSIEAKIAEIILALIDGVDELDVVANISAIKNNDFSFLHNEIYHIIEPIKQKNKIIKIIIESGVLTDEEIVKSCQLYGEAQIDFLKTSTGYAEKGASLEAVRLFRQHLPQSVNIKASGGIKSANFAKELLAAGATRLGCSASVQLYKECQYVKE